MEPLDVPRRLVGVLQGERAIDQLGLRAQRGIGGAFGLQRAGGRLQPHLAAVPQERAQLRDGGRQALVLLVLLAIQQLRGGRTQAGVEAVAEQAGVTPDSLRPACAQGWFEQLGRDLDRHSSGTWWSRSGGVGAGAVAAGEAATGSARYVNLTPLTMIEEPAAQAASPRRDGVPSRL